MKPTRIVFTLYSDQRVASSRRACRPRSRNAFCGCLPPPPIRAADTVAPSASAAAARSCASQQEAPFATRTYNLCCKWPPGSSVSVAVAFSGRDCLRRRGSTIAQKAIALERAFVTHTYNACTHTHTYTYTTSTHTYTPASENVNYVDRKAIRVMIVMIVR